MATSSCSAAPPRARRRDLVAAQGHARRGETHRGDGAARGARGDRPGGAHPGPVGAIEYSVRAAAGRASTRPCTTSSWRPTGGDLARPRPRVRGGALGRGRRGRGAHELPDRARHRGPRAAIAGVADPTRALAGEARSTGPPLGGRPLHERHVAPAPGFIDFGGWEMPRPVRAASSTSTAPSASAPGSSTSRTWASCGCAARAPPRRSGTRWSTDPAASPSGAPSTR